MFKQFKFFKKWKKPVKNKKLKKKKWRKVPHQLLRNKPPLSKQRCLLNTKPLSPSPWNKLLSPAFSRR